MAGAVVGLVLQIFESGEEDFFVSVDFVFAAAFGLEVVEFGAVAVQAAVHALLVEAGEFEAAGLG